MTEETPTTAPAENEPGSFTKMLRCKLSPDERLAKATAWATVLNERDAVEDELADIKTSARERLKKIDERATKLRQDFETGTEERAVRCTEDKDFGRNIVLVRRADTGETIEERAMDARERQLELDAVPPGEDKPNGKPRGRGRRKKAVEGEEVSL